MNTKAADRDATHYLSLRYPVVLAEMPPEDGGGYRASIPQLGARAFAGAGDTPMEALRNLEEARQELIPRLVSQGVVLPEPLPDRDDAETFSGSLMLRVPKTLHARISREAARSGCSINKLATEVLAAGLERRRVEELMACVDDTLDRCARTSRSRAGVARERSPLAAVAARTRSGPPAP